MARLSTLAVRRAVVVALKRDAAVAAIVATKVHVARPASPDRPFLAFTSVEALPRRATGMDGSDVAFRVSAFAEGTDDAPVEELAAAAVNALDGRVLTLGAPYFGKAHISWLSTQTLPDGVDANAWHGLSRFTATAVT